MPHRRSTIETGVEENSTNTEALGLESKTVESLEDQQNQVVELVRVKTEEQVALEKEGDRLAIEMRARMDALHRMVEETKLEISHLLDLRKSIVDEEPISDAKVNLHAGKSPSELRGEFEALIQQKDNIDNNLSDEERIILLANIERVNREMGIWVEKYYRQLLSEKSKLEEKKRTLEFDMVDIEHSSGLSKLSNFVSNRKKKKDFEVVEADFKRTQDKLLDVKRLYFETVTRKGFFERSSYDLFKDKLKKGLDDIAEEYADLAKSSVVCDVGVYNAKMAMEIVLDKDGATPENRKIIGVLLDDHLNKAKDTSRRAYTDSDLNYSRNFPTQFSENYLSKVRSIANSVVHTRKPYDEIVHLLIQFDLAKKIEEIVGTLGSSKDNIDGYDNGLEVSKIKIDATRKYYSEGVRDVPNFCTDFIDKKTLSKT